MYYNKWYHLDINCLFFLASWSIVALTWGVGILSLLGRMCAEAASTCAFFRFVPQSAHLNL